MAFNETNVSILVLLDRIDDEFTAENYHSLVGFASNLYRLLVDEAGPDAAEKTIRKMYRQGMFANMM